MAKLISKPSCRGKTVGDHRGGHNRYGCNYDFFKQWTDKMAYVLGFLYADGNIVDAVSSRTQYIQFSSVDKEILVKIKKSLGSRHPIHIQLPRLIKHKNGDYKSRILFTLRIGSRAMFDDLINLGVIPNKSKTVKFPLIPIRYLGHFTRGYFDGDGCIFFEKAKGKRQKNIIKRLSVIFTSGSKEFLEGLNSSLKKVVSLDREGVYDSHDSYQLRYSTSESIKLFKFLYKNIRQNLYLRRKLKNFINYFELRPLNIDRNIEEILRNLNYGHVAEKFTQRSAKPLTPVRFRPWPQACRGAGIGL